jgi:putative SOS response-associated peptidase YedK
MCARFTLKTSAVVLQQLFELDEVPEITPRYNIAPSQFIAAVVNHEGRRELRYFKWGLVPSWAKDPSIAQNLINAKAETAAEKPSFRAAFKRRRCLIPADGFFEWCTVEPDSGDTLFHDLAPLPKSGRPIKQPYYITLKDGGPFAMAGLYEYWEGPEQGPIESCTILTIEPNELVAQYHNRMPAILRPENYATWLDPEAQSSEMLQALLTPLPQEEMSAMPVTRRMNNPRFDTSECVDPLVA